MVKRARSQECKKQLIPLLLDLSARSVVIFGGGRVGERKAQLFSRYARVVVVSKSFSAGLQQMAEDGRAELICADLTGDFQEYLEDAFIAIPATSDRALNAALEEAAASRGVLVNRVDEAGEVVVPSILRRDPLTIAISTESPALSKYLRQRLEVELTGNYQEMARLLAQIRGELKETVPGQGSRSRIIWSILQDPEVWRLLDISYEKAYMRAREHVVPG
jgi:precorrin-2 dehydrogenase/sirohydrochlorin ferrochelatase